MSTKYIRQVVFQPVDAIIVRPARFAPLELVITCPKSIFAVETYLLLTARNRRMRRVKNGMVWSLPSYPR